MKRSRAGTAILVIFLLVAGFVVAALVASFFHDADADDSQLTGLFGSEGNKIGVVNIEGTLVGCDEILKQLRKFKKKKSVRAIVLRINSPGGTVAPAQEIYREIGKIRKDKPVVASMETMGTSAAYYIASAADNVVCSEGTITGSIGVIMVLAEVHKVIEKLGVDVNVIKAGKFKDIGSAVKPLTDAERQLLESFAREIHEQFIKDVAAARKGKIDEKELREVADGRFISGAKAKELGLADTIGNFYDAIKLAAELGGIKTEPELVYPEKKWRSYVDMFTESASSALVDKLIERTRLMDRTPLVR